MHVICAGMRRSCSTWQYLVASDCVTTYYGGAQLGFLEEDEYQSTVVCGEGDPNRPELAREQRQVQWICFKTHRGRPAFSVALDCGGASAFYSFRDIRDATYSLMYKCAWSFEDLVFRYGMLSRIIADHEFWITQPNTLVQRYEAIVSRPATAVKQISKHLGLKLSLKCRRELQHKYSLESNRVRTANLASRLEAAGVVLTDSVNVLARDPISQLHWNHIRNGSVGGWRETATPDHLRVFEEICGRWLVKYGYETSDRAADWTLPKESAREHRRMRQLECRENPPLQRSMP